MRRKPPGKESIHQSVFELVGVRDGVPIIEADDLVELITYSPDHPIGNVWLNQVLETRGAIFVRIGLLERRRPYIHRALYIESRDILDADRIDLVPVKQPQARFELNPRRVESGICRIKGELLRIKS